ncbi:hypothetical protein BaRGS_00000575 [Batillaria attramentaria]|uniref:Uncharacterized protein n=1 Tax=Batillaria attramentaria TaxID=370345 RepID=A0ABD0MAY4_9CAEN
MPHSDLGLLTLVYRKHFHFSMPATPQQNNPLGYPPRRSSFLAVRVGNGSCRQERKRSEKKRSRPSDRLISSRNARSEKEPSVVSLTLTSPAWEEIRFTR